MSWLSALCDFLYEMFFGCSHGHLSRPFTLQASSYKVCLDCGRQMPYSLDEMRLLRRGEMAKLSPQSRAATVMPIAVEFGLSQPQDSSRIKVRLLAERKLTRRLSA